MNSDATSYDATSYDKVFVTGGAGLIGSHIVDLLVDVDEASPVGIASCVVEMHAGMATIGDRQVRVARP